jgi:Mg2+ and Co2+ transporter CorA
LVLPKLPVVPRHLLESCESVGSCWISLIRGFKQEQSADADLLSRRWIDMSNAKLVTKKEIAARYSAHPKTVEKWVDAGIIPVVKSIRDASGLIWKNATRRWNAVPKFRAETYSFQELGFEFVATK